MEKVCPPSADYTIQPVHEGMSRETARGARYVQVASCLLKIAWFLEKTPIQTHHILITHLKTQQL